MRVLLIALLLGTAAPGLLLGAPLPGPRLPLGPELRESVPLIRADAVHRLGITGAGVSVAVVDIFSPNPADPCRYAHGAWVEGIVRGVAPGAEVLRYPVRTVPGSRPGSCYVIDGEDLRTALEEVLDERERRGIRVVNLSWGGGSFERPCSGQDGEVAALIRRLRAAGVLVVAAAGNAGRSDALMWPACMPEVLSVGAVYDVSGTEPEVTPVCARVPEVDAVTCYSNSAPFLDLLAPGSRIRIDSGLSGLGTSAAAPHVAGVAALVLSVRPALEPAALGDLLEAGGRPVRDPRNGLTFPRVDALAAVRAVLEEAPPPPQKPDPHARKGDVNLDGKVDGQDVLLLLSALGGLVALDEAQTYAADVAPPCDRRLNFSDWRKLKAIALEREVAACDGPQAVAGEGAVGPLVATALRVRLAAGELRFSLRNATALHVQVFDLAGSGVFDSGKRTGDSVRWSLRDHLGRPPANGIYLVLVRARDAQGQRHTFFAKITLVR